MIGTNTEARADLFKPQEANMTKILKTAARFLRGSLATPSTSPEEAYIAGATDLIDLEMRQREMRRRSASQFSRLGGAARF